MEKEENRPQEGNGHGRIVSPYSTGSRARNTRQYGLFWGRTFLASTPPRVQWPDAEFQYMSIRSGGFQLTKERKYKVRKQ